MLLHVATINCGCQQCQEPSIVSGLDTVLRHWTDIQFDKYSKKNHSKKEYISLHSVWCGDPQIVQFVQRLVWQPLDCTVCTASGAATLNCTVCTASSAATLRLYSLYSVWWADYQIVQRQTDTGNVYFRTDLIISLKIK